MIAVFDLGGVLVRICRTWGQAMATAGFQAKPEHENLWFDECPPFKQFQAGLISETEYEAGLAEFLGLGNDPEQGRRVHNGILREEYPGALELVQELPDRGWQTGFLSNTNAIHWEVLTDPAHFPAVAALQHQVGSQQVGLEKPDPAFYRYFENLVQIQPREIIFFDDLPANVEAARSCGWQAHLVDHDGDTVAQMRTLLAL